MQSQTSDSKSYLLFMCGIPITISCFYSNVNITSYGNYFHLIHIYSFGNVQMAMSNHQVDIETPNLELPRGTSSSLTKSWVCSVLANCRIRKILELSIYNA